MYINILYMCLEIYQLGKVVTAWDNKINFNSKANLRHCFFWDNYTFLIRSGEYVHVALRVQLELMETGFQSGIYVLIKSRRVVGPS